MICITFNAATPIVIEHALKELQVPNTKISALTGHIINDLQKHSNRIQLLELFITRETHSYVTLTTYKTKEPRRLEFPSFSTVYCIDTYAEAVFNQLLV